MLLHYFKIAWRNLLKYKTQNIISILSLAVGTVCFAITFYIMRSVVLDIYLSEIDTGIARVSVYQMTEEQYKQRGVVDENFADIQHRDEIKIDCNFIKRLKSLNLPSIREIHYCALSAGVNVEYETKEGEKKILMTHIKRCSPRYFHYRYYCSAITGERIPELREGDILITADIRDKVYGKGVDPRGLRINNLTTVNSPVISDVLETGDELSNSFSGIFIVSSLPNEYYSQPYLYIELAQGTSAAQLQKELSSAMPEYDFSYIVNDFDWSDEGIIFVVFVSAIIFLGCSVLLISVIGFLKMQLQLFSLRSREIALRRTMGARPRQLSTLLNIEIIIVFIFAALASIAITAILANYTLPIIDKLFGGIVFNLDAIYSIALWIIVCTLLVTMLAAVLSVYRYLHKPVGLRVGRSGKQRTVGQSIMLSVQLGVSMLFILAILGLFYIIKGTYEQQSEVLPDEPSSYRNALLLSDRVATIEIPDIFNRLMQTGVAAHISYINLVHSSSPTLDTELMMHYIKPKDENVWYEYSYTMTDEQLVDYLKFKITTNYPTENKKNITAVYVRTEEVERLREKWGVKALPNATERKLYKQRSYTLIGYAKAPKNYVYAAIQDYTPAYWIIDNDVDEIEEKYYDGRYIIFPREGKYSRCEDAVVTMYREARPDNINDVPIACLYDSWFSELRFLELMSKIALLLVAVSILTIVASVYSNISLESRGRRKEIALRKIHGAKSIDVIRLLGGYYVRLLTTASIFVSAVWLLLCVVIHTFAEPLDVAGWIEVLCYLLAAILIVALVTLTTIGNKIYSVSRINAAEVIKNE